MSGLLKKRIQVDRNLATVIGVADGATVSYAEIQKGLHQYIKEHNLRIDETKVATSTTLRATEPEPSKGEVKGVYCFSCGEAIPSGAVFCDLCGVMQ